MQKKVGAILLDTRSIQKYVFASNKLKTNVGASYLVDWIFTEFMCKEILPKFEFKKLETDWKENTELKLLADTEVECEVAYIGGGNMLVLVRITDADGEVDLKKSLAKCREIVKAWSSSLLVKCPGLKVGCAVAPLDITDGTSFKKSLDELYKILKDNQNTLLPMVDLPYTGLTEECPVSGKAAEVTVSVKHGDEIYASHEVKVKLDAYNKSQGLLLGEIEDAENKLMLDRKAILNKSGEVYTYADELENIGNASSESYICVIHIDGNNMGESFSKCESMQERKSRSLEVANEVNASFNVLLDEITEEYNDYEAKGLDVKQIQKGGSKRLPIRPIIIGGDDVTFITAGRMGLVYAQRYLNSIAQSGKFSCCAGVAIVPGSYPFFRAYQLAEQLCSAAKKNSRNLEIPDKENNWLDFAILHGEMSSQLEVLREEQYTSPLGYALHYGPYKVGGTEANHSFEKLLALSAKLIYKTSHDNKAKLLSFDKRLAARNKIKKLREVLLADEHKMNIFMETADDLKKVIKDEEGDPYYSPSVADLWIKDEATGTKVTRYMDAIEIIDFLPKDFGMEVKL